MKGYIILFVLISHFSSAQIWTDTIPDWDHNDISKIKIEYSGDWVHMTNKPGSYPQNSEAKAVYNFWGHQINVYTELMRNHSYYIVDIDGRADTVNVSDDRNLVDQLTWSSGLLNYGNHVLELRGGLFVLNKLIKFVDSNPYPPDSITTLEPCLSDTVYITDTIEIIKWDTVRITDTLYLPSEIIYKLLIPKVEHDTLILN